MIVDRRELRATIARLLAMLQRQSADAVACERRRCVRRRRLAWQREPPTGAGAPRCFADDLPSTLADWLAHCERLHPNDDRPALDARGDGRARLGIALRRRR